MYYVKRPNQCDTACSCTLKCVTSTYMGTLNVSTTHHLHWCAEQWSEALCNFPIVQLNNFLFWCRTQIAFLKLLAVWITIKAYHTMMYRPHIYLDHYTAKMKLQYGSKRFFFFLLTLSQFCQVPALFVPTVLLLLTTCTCNNTTWLYSWMCIFYNKH